MALAAPFAGALLGGALGGQYGMLIGWTLGSWVANAFTQQKNEVFDPGAEEMPRFNQALRGVTIPVFFDTNRASSQID